MSIDDRHTTGTAAPVTGPLLLAGFDSSETLSTSLKKAVSRG
jgi:hypothetical protein